MKHIKFNFTMILMISLLTISCKKDSSNNNGNDNASTNPTKTEILCTGKWYTSSWATQNLGGPINEYVDRSLDCQKDDGIIFHSNGKMTYINPVKCRPIEYDDGFQDDWHFYNADETVISIAILNYPVVSITRDEIRLYKVYDDSSKFWWNLKPLK